MRQGCQPGCGRCNRKWGVARRQISGARHHLVEGDESRQDVARLARGLRFEGHDRADVRRDAAGRAARIARNLSPRLRELMHCGPRETGAHDRHIAELVRGVRHQTLRKPNLSEGRRREIQRSPSTFLQIPCVNVTRCAGEEDHDAVFRRAMERGINRGCALKQPGVRDRQKIRGHDSRSGDFEELPPRESGAADRKRSAPFAIALRSLRHGLTPQLNRNSSLFSSANCRSSDLRLMSPLRSTVMAALLSAGVG